MASYDVTLRLWRGDAGGGELRDYTVPVEDGEVVLDAVHHVQATQAGDLAVRWNCKAGKCGSCSAEVNGKPRLLCMTRLSVFDRDKPIMDVLGFHPYPAKDRDPLAKGYQWPNAGIANLNRIKQAIWDAFDGTAQPTFAEACAAHDLTFIGPRPEVLERAQSLGFE